MPEKPLSVTEIMLAKGFGGAERSFLDTCLSLAARGHTVQAICDERFVRRSDLEATAGIEVVPVRCRGTWDPWCPRTIRRAVADFKPDLMHSHLARSTWMAGVALRGVDVPLVCKLHNYAKLGYYEAVDHFIGTTPDQRRYLLEAGVADARISVIPNFSRVTPADDAREQASGSTTFVTLGRLHRVKGYDILLRAMKIAVDDGANIRLLIGGEGGEETSLRSLCSELGLDRYVEFAGYQADAARFLDRGDVYVLPSRSESFGIALVEAMARGLPAVCTRTKGPSQILAGDEAWWADPEDVNGLAAEVVAAVTDEDARRRRAKQSLAIFRDRYSEGPVVDRLVSLFQMIRNSGGREIQLDNGRVTATLEAGAALERAGLSSAKEILKTDRGEVFREVDGRRNVRLRLPPVAGETYLKCHAGSESAGPAEHEAVRRCRRAGVPVFKALASGSSRGRSFFLSRQAGDGESITELFRGRLRTPDTLERADLIAAAAVTCRRLHQAGLFHRDLYFDHLYATETEDGFVAELIDVQRLIEPTSALERASKRLKDVGQIRFSTVWTRMTAVEIALFAKVYFTGRCDGRLSFAQRLFWTAARLRQAGRELRLRRRGNPLPALESPAAEERNAA